MKPAVFITNPTNLIHYKVNIIDYILKKYSAGENLFKISQRRK